MKARVFREHDAAGFELARVPAMRKMPDVSDVPRDRLVGSNGKDAVLDRSRAAKDAAIRKLAQFSGGLSVASLEFADHVATSSSILSHRSNVDWVTLNV